MNRRLTLFRAALLVCALAPLPCAAQVTPAAGYTPPDDTPSIRVGATLFADYTVQSTRRRSRTPTATKSRRTPSTSAAHTSTSPATSRTSSPSASRPTSRARPASAARLNGSYTFRLKYAFAQFNLDDWINRAARLVDAPRHPADAVGRLRGRHLPLPLPGHDVRRARRLPDLVRHRGVVPLQLPSNYGDVHVGVYNGENYRKPEVNDQKALQIRGTLRPLHDARRCCAACGSPGSTTTTTTSRTRERKRAHRRA